MAQIEIRFSAVICDKDFSMLKYMMMTMVKAMMTNKAEGLFSNINRPLNPHNLTDLEKRHLPVISAPAKIAADLAAAEIAAASAAATDPVDTKRIEGQ